MSAAADCEPLTWEAPYAIALALQETYPRVDLDEVSLEQLKRWVVSLPCFADDPALAHEGLLLAILREWLEIVLEEAALSLGAAKFHQEKAR